MAERAHDAPMSAEEDDPNVGDLVWRLGEGEQSALAEAYERHHDVVRAFARRLLGDHDAAEDLVHDVFLTLPKAARRFEGRSSLRTFLLSIAVHRCRQHVRSAARYREAKERYARVPRPASAPGPSEAHGGSEMAEVLARALDGLPLDQRVAFVLCAIEERTSAEAARIVGVPENTIRTRTMRARQKLRELLEREGWAP